MDRLRHHRRTGTRWITSNMSRLTTAALIGALLLTGLAAVPAWRNHMIRSRVQQALAAADAAKLVVMEAATMRGGVDKLEAGDLHYNPAAVADALVEQVTVAGTGAITVATRRTGASPDPVFVLTPRETGGDGAAATLIWSCRMTVGAAAAAPPGCPPAAETAAVP